MLILNDTSPQSESAQLQEKFTHCIHFSLSHPDPQVVRSGLRALRAMVNSNPNPIPDPNTLILGTLT